MWREAEDFADYQGEGRFDPPPEAEQPEPDEDDKDIANDEDDA